jgi:hypothetical protein
MIELNGSIGTTGRDPVEELTFRKGLDYAVAEKDAPEEAPQADWDAFMGVETPVGIVLPRTVGNVAINANHAREAMDILHQEAPVQDGLSDHMQSAS